MENRSRFICVVICAVVLIEMIVFLVITELRTQRENEGQINDYVNFEVIYDDTLEGLKVVYDKNTGVMYAVMYSGKRLGITPLYNADGSLQIYEEPSKKIER